MGTMYKICLLTIMLVGFVYTRSNQTNSRMVENKIKSEHFWAKVQYENDDSNKLERKRSHKRRRKIRKPVKGLR